MEAQLLGRGIGCPRLTCNTYCKISYATQGLRKPGETKGGGTDASTLGPSLLQQGSKRV